MTKVEKPAKGAPSKALSSLSDRKNELRSLVQELMKSNPRKKTLIQLSAQAGVDFHEDTSILMSNILHEMSGSK